MKQREFKTTVLANGLRIIAEIMPSSKSAALGFFVNTGSRDEDSEIAGVSHFLEHMMFKGTPQRSAIQVGVDLGNLAVQANAYTNSERTVFYGAVLPEYFREYHELLSDMMRPSLDPQEFATEKNVILEEIGMYQDKPYFYFFEKALHEYYQGQGLGNSVLGSNQSVGAMRPEQMREYFEKRYVPRNTVLAASGNISWEHFVEDAQKYAGTWKDVDTKREYKTFVQPQINKTYFRKNISQAQVLLMIPGPTAQSMDRYAATVLAMVIGDGAGSRLYWDLVDSGMAESAGLDTDENDQHGSIYATATCEPSKVEEVRARLLTISSTFEDITQEEVERAKNKLAARIVLGGELPMSRLMAIGVDWLYRGEYDSLSDIVAHVRAVTLEKVIEVARKYPLKNWSQFLLLPEA